MAASVRRNPRAIVLGRAIAPADVRALCERVTRLVADGSLPSEQPVVVDAGRLRSSDLGTIDALARIALTATRLGRPVRIVGASTDLLGLIAFCGLARRIPSEAVASVEPRR